MLLQKGNRPSYIKASKPEIAIPLYEILYNQFKLNLVKKYILVFFLEQIYARIELVLDGPVTIIIDGK
jgi:D-tyrosyl-tRNA(Tyr) deacylase